MPKTWNQLFIDVDDQLGFMALLGLQEKSTLNPQTLTSQ